MWAILLGWTLGCAGGLLIRGGDLTLSIDASLGQLTGLTASLPDGKDHIWYSSQRGNSFWQATLQTGSSQVVVDCFDPSGKVTVVGTSILTQLGDYDVDINMTLSSTADGIAAKFITSSYSTWTVAELSLQLPLRGSTESSLFVPKGWGMVYDRIFGIPEAVSLVYPSSEATMQFCALLDQPVSLYLATHDPTAMQKRFGFEAQSTLACDLTGDCAGRWWVDLPLPYQSQWTQPFEIVLAALPSNGTNDWFDAAAFYRDQFVDAHSSVFAQPGIPAWFRATPLVINSGWSPYDVLETTQGDPETVLADAKSIRSLFPSHPILFHWYVWYAGAPNFDLDYPTCYVPQKLGFAAAVKQLQAMDIQVMPYFNGRLFDTTLASFPSNRSRMIERDGKLHTESYGNGRKFAVPCPSLAWWRDLQTGTMSQIAQSSSVQAIYIDQLGAAVPLLCTASDHNHTPGGGSYFAQGNLNLLSQLRQGAEKDDVIVLVTENNAEPYLAQAHGFLTVANWYTFPRLDASYVPAFQAVHRALTIGRVYDEFDLLSTNWLSEKAAEQFVYGSMQGWFSWHGLIGLGDFLNNYPEFLSFLNDLLTLRVLTASYFIDFRMQRPPTVTNPTPGVFAAVWGNSTQVALFVLNSNENSTLVQLVVDYLPTGTISQLFLNSSVLPVTPHQAGPWLWQDLLGPRDFRCFLVECC